MTISSGCDCQTKLERQKTDGEWEIHGRSPVRNEGKSMEKGSKGNMYDLKLIELQVKAGNKRGK